MAIQPDHFWSHNTMRDSPFKDSGAHKRKMELIKGWRSSLKNGGSHRRKTEVIQKLKHRKEKQSSGKKNGAPKTKRSS